MQKEILLVAEAVSGEKGLPQEAIFEAIEQALATATKKRYEDNTNIEVIIDHKTGDYETFRVWEYVAEEDFEDAGFQIIQDEKNELGSVKREQVENIEFGRIAAQAAKQVIVQKVREAERAQVVEKYRSVLGELVNGTVKKVTREFLIIDLGEGAEAILSRNELIPGEVFRIGDRLRAVLQEEERENRGPQLALSRKCPEMVGELFKLEVPEISEQVIEIKAIARDPGSRTKIAVKTNDNRIDPVGACVGMRGSRVQAVSNELGNERLDIVIWDDDPAQLLINSMGPVEITSIILDEAKGSMDVVVTQDTLAQAIGKSGQNVRLSSQINGWKLNVLDQETADEQSQEKSESISTVLMDRLDVDADLAETLIANAFHETSGDIVGLPDGYLYWTVFGDDSDVLVRVDPNTGVEVEIGPVGYSRLFGLGYSDGQLYGFNSEGQVLRMSPQEGQAILSAQREDLSWWGAATNPVAWN